MTLRRLVIGSIVWIPATPFVSASWSQGQPNRTKSAKGGYSYDYSYGFSDFSPDTFTSFYPDEYNAEIKKSLTLLRSEAERQASGQFITELQKKSSLEIFRLKHATDLCQQIACLALSPDKAREYIAEFQTIRDADDRQNISQRSVAAAERSAAAAESNTHIAEAALGFSFLSLLISALTFWRTSSTTKSAIAA
jgi:hypothetical protein